MTVVKSLRVSFKGSETFSGAQENAINLPKPHRQNSLLNPNFTKILHREKDFNSREKNQSGPSTAAAGKQQGPWLG